MLFGRKLGCDVRLVVAESIDGGHAVRVNIMKCKFITSISCGNMSRNILSFSFSVICWKLSKRWLSAYK